jgi:hypothetical protein
MYQSHSSTCTTEEERDENTVYSVYINLSYRLLYLIRMYYISLERGPRYTRKVERGSAAPERLKHTGLFNYIKFRKFNIYS